MDDACPTQMVEGKQANPPSISNNSSFPTPQQNHDDNTMDGLSRRVEAFEGSPLADDDPGSPQSDSTSVADCSLASVTTAMETGDLANYGPTIEEHCQHVREFARKSGAKSTKAQYDRKMQEYNEFAIALYGDTEVTYDRAFKFLQFQAHRPMRIQREDDPKSLEQLMAEADSSTSSPQRPSRKRKYKKTNKLKSVKYVFNPQDYKDVMDHIQRDVIGRDVDQWVRTNRLGSIDKYHSALMEAASNEVRTQLKLGYEVKKLVDNVNNRAKMAKVDGNAEELCRVTEKFLYPELYPLIEEHLWNEHVTTTNWKYMASTMRTRYTFLSTTQTCTRHEATVSCKLSAFDFAEVKLKGELKAYPLLIRNIYHGKINQEDSATILQAKSIRHKNPKLCEQGALAMYLFCRFHLHQEEFDLSDTKSWGNVRTAVALNVSSEAFKSSRIKKMRSNTYYEKITKVFAAHGKNASHVLHFGRSCLPVLLELAEVMTEVIQQLGGWEMDQFLKHYSLNMPWEGLRVAAGHEKLIGFYRSSRDFLRVIHQLRRLTYSNVYAAIDRFLLLPESEQLKLPTARKFIRVMDHLAEVFIQDCCELRYLGRTQHLMFTHPLFQHPLFLQYEKDFRAAYPTVVDPRNDPTLNPLNRVYPMMGLHIGEIKCQLSQGFHVMQQQMGMLSERMDTMNQSSSQMRMHFDRVIQGAYEAHMASPYRDVAVGQNPVRSPTVVSPPDVTQHCTTVFDNCTDEGDSCFAPSHVTYPAFDRLAYDSIERIVDDWFGLGNSPYKLLGGLSKLYDKADFRKSITGGKEKVQADKKMLQKMRRIGDYFEENKANLGGLDQVVEHLRKLQKTSNKTKETITGIDQLITRERRASK